MATTNPHASCNKQRAFAWAKYYESVNQRLRSDHTNYTRTQLVKEDATIPTHIKEEFLKMGAELKKTWECPICIEMINPDNLEITNCGHYFCKPCLAGFKERNMRTISCNGCCPVCRRKFPTV